MQARLSISILFFAILLRSMPGSSQAGEAFTGEASEYPAELTSFMQKNINAESEAILTAFLILWNDSSLTSVEQERIIETSRLLAERNARPFPHFSNYLDCILDFRGSFSRWAHYADWETGLDMLLQEEEYSIQEVNQYLEFSRLLADSALLYRSRSVTWKATSPAYHFVLDSTVRIGFDNTDLICYSARDSIILYQTRGSFDPITNIWSGEEGRVTWERAGFDPKNVFAELSSYEIDMTAIEYRADHVIFTNNRYFDEAIEGNLLDRVKYNKTAEDADYPRFDTYQKDFQVTGLYDDINYTGGLSMQGAKLIGTGDQLNPAVLYIFQNDSLRLIARSAYFAFKSTRIDAPTTEIIIRLRNDSIYHPGIAFSYLLSNRELTLTTNRNFTSQSPFFDSYHNIDMTFDQLIWRMDESYMRFGPYTGSTIGNATFESVNYFNNAKYLGMQGMDEVHPLISIRSFAQQMGTDAFLADDFARYLRKPIAQVKQLIMRMAVQGFVYYDTETGMTTIKPRLHDYLAASVKLIDYDAISFSSRTSAPLENAIFDLNTYDLQINGIPQIVLSERQQVAIYPLGARITMKKNRDFSFDGLVEAGLFSFMGKDLFFSYDSFDINMPKIDSLHISYLTEEVDDYGFNRVANVNNLIQDATGKLTIDKPDNKSGRTSYSEYPVFQSAEEGFVYYDDMAIQNGVYDADNFYFKIYPFMIDSLNNFNYHTMTFEGELVSANIFPTIYETLSLHADNSLGFLDHMTPDSGFAAYGGKGYFFERLNLSKKGLTGDGIIRYLNAEIQSSNILFLPDSVMATADEFTITRKTDEVEFPMTSSSNDEIVWYPFQDELYAYRIDNDFSMFNDSLSLAGDLMLEPSGLSGWGRISMDGAEFESNMYAFKANEVNADTIDFYLRSLHGEGYTVLANNMTAHLDFSKQLGSFRSNDDFALVTFPENQYVSYLEYFEWDMQQKELAMGSLSQLPEGQEASAGMPGGPQYISLDPDQDSLSFIAPVAYYDYDSILLRANRVEYIDVADVRIYPAKEELVILPDGNIRTLTHAGILASRTSQFHNLYNATVAISGRFDYVASADYDYVDEADQRQVIFFSNIAPDGEHHTMASGEIIEPDHFTLSPNYGFQGKVFLEADSQFLTFDGATKIEDVCDDVSNRWLAFTSVIDPVNIMIPVGEKALDIDGNLILNGIYMSYDSIHVYPAFLSGRKNYSDKPVVASSGYLYYEKATAEYLIGEKEKILNPAAPGNLVSLNRETCELYGEGKLDLGSDLGQVKLTSLGNIRYQADENRTELNVILGMDFFVNEDVIDQMAFELDSIPNLQATDLGDENYIKGITQLIGREEFDDLRSELSLFGSVRNVPEELRYTIMLSELRLRWDDGTNSWKSVGRIGVASINETQVNKRMNGLIEIQVRRSGDMCDLYLEANRRNWYYFGYTRGVMQILTASSQILEEIKDLNNRQRRLQVQGGDESYIYMISTDAKKDAFVRKYQDEAELQDQQLP